MRIRKTCSLISIPKGQRKLVLSSRTDITDSAGEKEVSVCPLQGSAAGAGRASLSLQHRLQSGPAAARDSVIRAHSEVQKNACLE